MGIEIWAQTHTHTKPQTTKKKAIIDTRRHWDGNGLYSPPGANLVHLAHLFRSFTKQAFSAGIFFFSLFPFFLYCPFISLVLSGRNYGRKAIWTHQLQLGWAASASFTCKEEEFSILFWARDNGNKTPQLAVQTTENVILAMNATVSRHDNKKTGSARPKKRTGLCVGSPHEASNRIWHQTGGSRLCFEHKPDHHGACPKGGQSLFLFWERI